MQQGGVVQQLRGGGKTVGIGRDAAQGLGHQQRQRGTQHFAGMLPQLAVHLVQQRNVTGQGFPDKGFHPGKLRLQVCAEFLHGLEFREQFFYAVHKADAVNVGLQGHARGGVMVQQRNERVVKAVQVQGEQPAFVLVQLVKRMGFNQFIQRSDATGQGNHQICVAPHPFLALGHGVSPHHLRDAGILQSGHEAGQHGDVHTAAADGLVALRGSGPSLER